MFKLSKELTGLRTALGDEVSDQHFVARALSDNLPHGHEFVRALNDRYTKVFMNDRMEWESDDRRKRLSKDLRDPEKFSSFDAEVQAAATILTHNDTRLRAQSEGELEGERKCDFLLLAPRVIEIEIRLVCEFEVEQEFKRIENSIMNRLKTLQRPQDTSLILRVHQTRDEETGKLLLNQAAEKGLERAVKKVLEDRTNQNSYVTLSPDGTGEVWNGQKSLAGILAFVEIRKAGGKLPVVTFSGMKAPGGREEVRKALQRKRQKKQCTGNYPWIIVLDSTRATFRFEEMSEGVKDYLRNSKKTSAVVIQQRRFTTPGFGFSADDRWFFSFRSTIIKNTKPEQEHPILLKELTLFEASELKEL